MAYCAQADLETAISSDILRQLTDDDEDEDIDASVVTAAISHADSKIDTALSGRYVVPITGTVPTIVKFASVWLAVCIIGGRRGILPEDYVKQCEFYDQWLKDVRDGKVNVPGLTEIESGLPASSTSTQQREFVRSTFVTGGEVENNPDEAKTIDVW
ncbi:MAG: hypothetical protein A2Y38_22420 [Spirochaetes bacterium GWB1_59_5]|nr:MAG: hypothetical protein A2Y38_22420 [Spirochaetes bacterium GWB1_59_5]